MKLKQATQSSNPILLKIMRNAYKSNSIAHAYLLNGMTNNDLETSSLFIAQVILCKQDRVLACGECDRCIRVEQKKYLDLKIIEHKSIIKKESVKNAIMEMSQTSLEIKSSKVLIIKNIEKANKQSFNILLRFLEEPPENTYIILTTTNIDVVLNTIKSRVQTINIRSSYNEFMAEQLMEKGVLPNDAKILANIFHNREEALIEYQDNFDEKHKIVKDLLEHLSNNMIMNVQMLLSKKVNKLNIDIIIKLISFYFNETLRFKSNSNNIINSTVPLLKKLSTYNDYYKLVSLCHDAKKEINANTNFNLVKQSLIIKLGAEHE